MTAPTALAGAARSLIIRTDIPHSARVWNYWMGGKDYYSIDQIAGDAAITMMAVQSRQLLHRTVGYLTERAGIQQVPRYRCRPTGRGQHPRDRANRRVGVEGRLRRQRPTGPDPRAGTARRHHPRRGYLLPSMPTSTMSEALTERMHRAWRQLAEFELGYSDLVRTCSTSTKPCQAQISTDTGHKG